LVAKNRLGKIFVVSSLLCYATPASRMTMHFHKLSKQTSSKKIGRLLSAAKPINSAQRKCI